MSRKHKQKYIPEKLFVDGPVTILRIKSGHFILDVVDDIEFHSRLKVRAGHIHSILKTLKHEPSEAGELEAAIAAIEDRLMPVIKDLPDHRCLMTSETAFWTIANVTGVESSDSCQMDVDTVEEVFNRLVDVAYGTPASILKVPENREFAATVLFIRELMHHAKFNAIYLSQN